MQPQDFLIATRPSNRSFRNSPLRIDKQTAYRAFRVLLREAALLQKKPKYVKSVNYKVRIVLAVPSVFKLKFMTLILENIFHDAER